MSNGKQRYATSPQQIASFNKGSKPVQADDDVQSKCFLPDADTDCIIGNQVLHNSFIIFKNSFAGIKMLRPRK